ncbi:MAG: hypothetical protein MJ252_06200, partial [archaeon]|nr:hypothetical protein [archaeon]
MFAQKQFEQKIQALCTNNDDFWKVEEPQYYNIISKIDKSVDKSKKLNSGLEEEEKPIIRRKFNESSKSVDKIRVKTTKDEKSDESTKVQKIVKEVNEKFKEIKGITEDISNINALYFENKSDIVKRKLEASLKLPTIKEKYKIKNEKPNEEKTEEELEKEQDEKQEQKKKLNSKTNIRKESELYSKLLAKAFFHFNPIIHLGNLKMLREIDPEIGVEMDRITKNIDKDLEEVTSKDYYSKQYEKVKESGIKIRQKIEIEKEKAKQEKIKKEKAKQEILKRMEEVKRRKYQILKSEGSLSTEEKTLPNKVSKSITYLPFHKKKKEIKEEVVKRKFPDREMEEKNMQLQLVCNTKIKGDLDNNIDRYFNAFEPFDKSDLERQKKKFFPGLIGSFDILKEIEENKIMRDINSKNLAKKNQLKEDNNLL